MRTIILLVCTTSCISLTSSAQLEKGKFYGDLQLGKRFTRYSTWNAQTGVSLALSKHVAVGAYYNYTRYEKYATTYSSGFGNQNTYGISFDYLHYFGKSNKWGWYINSTVGYYTYNAYDKPSSGPTTFNYRVNGLKLDITPGIFYRASERLAMFANVGGAGITTYDHGHSRRLDFGSQLNIGLRIRLGKRK